MVRLRIDLAPGQLRMVAVNGRSRDDMNAVLL